MIGVILVNKGNETLRAYVCLAPNSGARADTLDVQAEGKEPRDQAQGE
jgi:hypothetical protein